MAKKQQLPFPEFPTLGYRLREAREQLGLAEVDIADQLRIDAPMIKKIENDGFEQEELTVFVRGYMRAYAKQVQFPVEEVDAFFIRRGLLQPALELAPAKFQFNQAEMARKKMHLTTVSVILILVVFILTWSFWQRPDDMVNNAKTILAVHQLPAQAAEPAQTIATTKTA